MSCTSVVLAALALLGAFVASAVTLAWDGAFPPAIPGAFDAALAEARGWSAVTLSFAVPLGGTALIAGARGSLRGRLTLGGVLAYLLYTYLEMAVSPPFTALYLVYVATFALAGTALVGTAFSLHGEDLDPIFARAPRRGVAVYAFLFAGGLTLAWLSEIVPRTLSGAFGYPTGTAAVAHVVHALDLGIFVPIGVATGVMLVARHRAAWHLATTTLGMTSCMALALAAMVGSSLLTQRDSLLGVLPFVGVAVASVGLGIWTFVRAS